MIGGYFSIQRCVFLAKDWEKGFVILICYRIVELLSIYEDESD
jgi:hypothetical protein